MFPRFLLIDFLMAPIGNPEETIVANKIIE